MSLPNEVIVSTSKLTAIGDAIRSRFGVSGDLTLDEMATDILSLNCLPIGYQQVDYIEGTGTQYIVFNYTPKTALTKFIIDVQYTGSVTSGNFGVNGAIGSYSSRFTMGYWDGKWQYAVTDSAYEVNQQADNNRHLFTLDCQNKKFIVDTQEYTMPTATFAYISKIGLFGRYRMGDASINTITSQKLYGAKIYEGETRLFDFIPCYRKSDKVIGMYDIINGQFYTNSGSGSFTCYPAPPSN